MDVAPEAPPLGRGAAETCVAVATAGAPRAIGPYSQGIAAGPLVFTSGQIGLDPATGALVDGGVAEEARRALGNLSAVLEAAGSSMALVVRTTVFLRSMSDFEAFNGVYAEFVGDPPPARTTVAAADLPRGASVEIDAIALRGR